MCLHVWSISSLFDLTETHHSRSLSDLQQMSMILQARLSRSSDTLLGALLLSELLSIKKAKPVGYLLTWRVPEKNHINIRSIVNTIICMGFIMYAYLSHLKCSVPSDQRKVSALIIHQLIIRKEIM